MSLKKDILRGFLLTLLQVILVLGGMALLGLACYGVVAGATAVSVGCIVGSVICLCAAAGVRYAKGHILRHRDD